MTTRALESGTCHGGIAGRHDEQERVAVSINEITCAARVVRITLPTEVIDSLGPQQTCEASARTPPAPARRAIVAPEGTNNSGVVEAAHLLQAVFHELSGLAARHNASQKSTIAVSVAPADVPNARPDAPQTSASNHCSRPVIGTITMLKMAIAR